MKRAVKYEINSIITTIIVLGIIIFVLLISSKHHERYDLTKQKKYSLSGQTVKILKDMKEKVKATGFFNKGSAPENQAKNLLEEYSYQSPRFTYELVDPDMNPLLAKRYEITLPGVIVFESGDKKEKVRDVTEESMTNSILKVTKAGKKTVYFLTGHDEMSVDETGNDGMSLLKASLEKEVYQAKSLSFTIDKKVPDDAAVVVIAGPKKPLHNEELDILKAYMEKGGRTFWLAGSDFPKETASFLNAYGFKINDDLVIDQVSRIFGGDYIIPAIMEYGTHQIVEKFRLLSFFPMTRSIELEKKKPDGSEITELAFSSQKSWGETDLEMLKKGKVRFDEKVDLRGPLCVAACGTYKIADTGKTEKPPMPPAPPVPDKKNDEKKARLVVFGSSQMADNAFINQGGNRDLILNSFGWLSEEGSLISIRAKDESGSPLTLTPKDMRFIFFFTVIFFPLIIIIIGLWVRIGRR